MAKNIHALIHGVSIYINPSIDMPVCVMKRGKQLAMGWTCWDLNPLGEKAFSVSQTNRNQPEVHKPSCPMVSAAVYRE
jgi:hypothetical protein